MNTKCNFTSGSTIFGKIKTIFSAGGRILVDFPIHIDTISMGLPIVHVKGSQVELPK